jgi:hypothetical protein
MNALVDFQVLDRMTDIEGSHISHAQVFTTKVICFQILTRRKDANNYYITYLV